MKERDARELDKLIRRAGSVLGRRPRLIEGCG